MPHASYTSGATPRVCTALHSGCSTAKATGTLVLNSPGGRVGADLGRWSSRNLSPRHAPWLVVWWPQYVQGRRSARTSRKPACGDCPQKPGAGSARCWVGPVLGAGCWAGVRQPCRPAAPPVSGERAEEEAPRGAQGECGGQEAPQAAAQLAPEGQGTGWVPAGEPHAWPHRWPNASQVWILWVPREAVFRGEAVGVSAVAPQGSECPAGSQCPWRWGMSTVDNTSREAA